LSLHLDFVVTGLDWHWFKMEFLSSW